MATKKTPADVLSLRKIVQEQAVEIAELTKRLEGKDAEANNAISSRNAYMESEAKCKLRLDNIHDLMDACPGVIPRTVEHKTSWGGTETKEQDVLVRLASWLGATR